MRKTSLILSISCLSLGACALIASTHTTAVESLAADAPSSVSNYTKQPFGEKSALLDLNDATDEAIRNYYQSLQGHSYNGTDLLKALKPILMNGQRYHNYDTSGSDIWKMYEITDRDWTLSPASEITNGTYDPVSNTISNYYYGSFSTPRDNPYLRLFYRNHDVPEARWHAWDHHGDNNGIDREHLWPKSRGFSKNDDNVECKYTGARGDLHHLVAADSFVNSVSHSNFAYGFVDQSKPFDDADLPNAEKGLYYRINDVTVVAGNLTGTSSTMGSGKVFEPQDSEKGDIARAMFYMAARYNNIACDDMTIDAGNPNLILADDTDNKTIYSKTDKAVSLGVLHDLLVWHHLDPVDEYEIHRNNLIYNNYDANRNPFIDFPEWADYIWGTVTFDETARRVTSYDSTPTGSVDLTKDVINGYREGGESSSSEQTPSEESSSEDTPEILPVGGVSHCYKATDTLTAGDTVSFIAPNLQYAMDETPDSSSAVEIVNDAVISNEPTAFTLGQNASGLFIQNSAGKYLTWSSGTTIRWADALAASSYWTIARYSDRDMVVNVASQSDKTTRALCFRGGTSNCFRAYAVSNNTGEYDPVLPFRATTYVDEATEWSTRFLSTWTAGCRDDGYVAEEMDWAKAESVRDMMSETGQLILSQKKIDDSVLGQAVERYDRIVGKYGETTFIDFLLRKPSLTSGVKSIRLTSNGTIDALLFIVLGVSAVSLIATPLFLTRKKRENQ